VKCVHRPIPDFQVISDKSLRELVDFLVRLLREENAAVYVHCYGGHGRTGTEMVSLLVSLFGIGKHQALQYLKRCHKARMCSHCALNRADLETPGQREQVGRVEGADKRKHQIDVTEAALLSALGAGGN